MERPMILFLLVAILATRLMGQETSPSLRFADLNPLTGIGSNATSAFTGWNGALQLTAIAVTPVLVLGGADRSVHNWFAEHQTLEPASLPAVWGAYVLPIALTGGLYTVGQLDQSHRHVAAACAVAQATGFAFVEQTLLKSLTGRPHPLAGPMDQEQVERFRFGFMEGGIHWGWPSGHMLTTAAIVETLRRSYPGNEYVRWGGYAYLGYSFGSALIHENAHMHHFSDAVAGTLMGLAIGRAVGSGFASPAGRDAPSQRTHLEPLLGERTGVKLVVLL